MNTALFKDLNPLASRQPKTDRLILPRFLKAASEDARFADEADRAHKILVHWAQLETDGTLATLKETQLQGDFLSQVFGDALGYTRATEGVGSWTLEQHQVIGTQTPDAVLGRFGPNVEAQISAVIELKGAKEHLDLGRSRSRSPVDQCWDYLINLPTTCRWGIVSNLISFRLYERNSSKRRYEHFSLQSLRDPEIFRRFFVLFRYDGLVHSKYFAKPQAVVLLEQTSSRQRAVGDELYQTYSLKRTQLINELHGGGKRHPLPIAIEWAQRLFDRIIFIAFCEDRDLLPPNTLQTAWDVKGFHAVTNPRWQSFKTLFRMVDAGGPPKSNIPGYNGGLFAKSPVDDLELDDDLYTDFFRNLGNYDFADEVNLDVLGHLFERSITEVEKLKESGFFGGDAAKAEAFARMPQSVKRKRLGIYYTPPELTSRIVQYTVQELIDERFNALPGDPESAETAYARLAILRNLKIVDPACGSGAFLFQAYDALELRYQEVLARLPEPERRTAAAQVPFFILNDNLYGVDLSPEAVEITQLALWIRSADRTQKLAKLTHNIVHGNSLVADPAVDPHAFDWKTRFPEVFDRKEPGFDCVIGNPPWERIKLQEREFFSLPAPEIATATNAAKRRALVKKLESEDSALYGRYEQAKAAAQALLDHCRSGDYPLTGRGDINTYGVFAELASNLVSGTGRVGLVLPTALVTTKTTSEFFAMLSDANRVLRLYDFTNRRGIFDGVERRQNFAMFCFVGKALQIAEADFVFRSSKIEEVDNPKRHVKLPGSAISLVNPNSKTAPVFKSTRDAQLCYAIYRTIPVLVDLNRKKTGNPWGIKFLRMFDQTNDAEVFREPDWLEAGGAKLSGNKWSDKKKSFLPLYEAKMTRPYNHRHASVVEKPSAWYMQGRSAKTTLVQLQNPEYLTLPRFWVDESEVTQRIHESRPAVIGFRDIARNDDTRTMLVNMTPFAGAMNTLPLIFTKQTPMRELCLVANLSAFALDYVVRQKLGDVHMNFFIVEQLPILPPDRYDEPCPWSKGKTLEAWIAERVLKLTCTAEDMLPLADACSFTAGSFKAEYGGRLNKWNDRQRAELMAELDAAFFHLYGLDHDDAEYVLSTFKGIHEGNPLLPGHPSTAKFIMELYDGFALQSGR